MSRTPASKCARFAFTVPTMTLFPKTKSRLIASAGTSTRRIPPVTLERTMTPFLPSSTHMASNTSGEKPVASKMRSIGPWASAMSLKLLFRVLT